MSPRVEDPTFPYAHNFARVIDVDDKRVELGFDLDPERWPWLMLPAQHPVRVEQYQFFGSVTALRQCLPDTPGRFSALTRYQWSCPEQTDEPQTRALCEVFTDEKKLGFSIQTYTDARQHAVSMSGEGVYFVARDFKAWRQRSRASVLEAAGSAAIRTAAAELLGLLPGAAAFVSDPSLKEGRCCFNARVGHDEGFHPTHLFHTGSGDHVNAAQQLDCALQACHRLAAREQGDRPTELMRCVAGQMRFLKFVELDAPFTLICTEQEGAKIGGGGRIGFRVEQAGEHNADLVLEFAAPEA